jgi:hypothetical protein
MRVGGTGAVEAGAAGLAWKLGLFKLIGGGAALLGAFLMAAVLEPKSKREMVLRAMVALGTSTLGTDWAMRIAASHLGVDMATLPMPDVIQYTLAMGGTIGAVSWFALGAIGELLKRIRRDPIGSIERLRGAGGAASPDGGDAEGPGTPTPDK